MTILVTGGAGFIGTNFVFNHLNYNDNFIIVYDKLTYAGNKKNFVFLEHNNKFLFIEGDITDKKILKQVFIKYQPQTVVNFAAETHVDNSIKSPEPFITSNIIGTFSLLEIIRDYYEALDVNNKKKFILVNVSTDEVFGSLTLKSKPFTENSSFLPNSPYSATKASADHLVRSYFQTYNIPSITTHCSNNFGPFQNEEKLIPKIIKNALNWNKIPIYGDGKNVRDWLFVDDHCDALNLIIKTGKKGDTYNIGGENEISNINLVKFICNRLDDISPNSNGPYKNLISFIKDRPGHDVRYAVDSSKLKNDLGWKSKNTFYESMDYTLKWYLKNFIRR